jgi:hypothetical protein
VTLTRKIAKAARRGDGQDARRRLLFSEDLNVGQEYQGVWVENPFRPRTPRTGRVRPSTRSTSGCRPPGSIDGRVIPDIAALAGPPYYDLIFQGPRQPERRYQRGDPAVGGAPSPHRGGLPAGKQLRFLTPLLYGAAPNGQPVGQAGCHDITSADNHNEAGNNGQPPAVPGYAAGPGYDAVSGWGTPIGTQLQQVLP